MESGLNYESENLGLSFLLYPLHITKYIIAANELGLNMLNTIPDNNVVKLFVTDKLSNLIIISIRNKFILN